MTSSATMLLIEQGWAVAQTVIPYILLLYIGDLLRTHSPDTIKDGLSAIATRIPHVCMRERRHLVYGIGAGGIIVLFTNTGLLLGILVTAAIAVHGIAKHSEIPKYAAPTVTEQITVSLAVLASIISILTGSTIAKTITAVAILGIIFWRI